MAGEKVMEEILGKMVNFDSRMEMLEGGNVDYGRYHDVSLRIA